ncbi:cysteine-rich small domain-containing protein [uncultured Cetobacterium sp.]|uniref:cysteine-rich small domain-containing protein n=1 Tax=uncultured Cetobacterium sp. TaxID=527638 RepID=UPI0026346838|nr:cysteine-rich small domain-containing protein [uncultured Cetobacterium sp.]
MNYKFNQNKSCEFFPCHKMEDTDNFNCLFCYCPLYMLGKDCGGNFRYTAGDIKDCSQCILPHIKDVGYDHIQKKMMEVIEIVRNEHLIETGQEDKIISLK